MGCGSGVTCWRRLRDWQEAGVGTVSTTPCAIASGKLTRSTGAGPRWTVRAFPPEGGGAVGANPTDRGKTQRGAPHEAPWCGGPARASLRQPSHRGQPPRLDGLRGIARCHLTHHPITQTNGRRRKRPAKLRAAKGDAYPCCRQAMRRRRRCRRIARKEIDASERLGRHRWVIERTLVWCSRYRRLIVRDERRAEFQRAFLTLGCALIRFNALQ